MNIFENYLNKIKEILINENSNKKILLPENLDSINVEIPPSKFNCEAILPPLATLIISALVFEYLLDSKSLLPSFVMSDAIVVDFTKLSVVFIGNL